MASATIKGETQPRTLTLLMSQARTRNSTLWTEDPKQQLAYLAAKRWARLYMPDVLLGVYTPDELELGDAGPRTIDMGRADVVKDNGHDSAPAALTVEQLADWRAAAAKGTAGARAHWLSMGDLRALATPEQKNEIWSSAVRVDEERAAAAAAAKTPAQPAADPSTGEIDDAFVAAMNAAEKEGVA